MNISDQKSRLFSPSSIAVFFFCAFVFLLFLRPIENEDIWWHLKTGEWILQNFQVPRYDLFPFGNEQTPWTFTQWLGSALIAMIDQVSGLSGVKVFRSLFFAGIIYLFFRYARGKAGFSLIMVLSLLILPALYIRSNLRPDIFNYFFIQIFLIHLFRFQETKDAKHLVPLPLWGILWSNMHLGSFVYGVPLIGTFLLANICSFLWRKLKNAVGPDDAAVKSGMLIAALGFYVLSFIVSPYGFKALLYPFKVFLDPSFINFYSASSAVEEMASPLKVLTGTTGLWAVLLFGLVLFFIFRSEDKANRLLYLLLSVMSFGLFLQGVRGGAFFALVVAYVIVQISKNMAEEKEEASDIPPKLTWVLIVLLMVPILFRLNLVNYKDGRLVRNMALDVETDNPKDALAFMKENHIDGQVFTNDLFGGYILWSSYPLVRPFIDGRQLNQEHLVQFLKVINFPGQEWMAAEKKYGFKILLLAAEDRYSFTLINALDLKEWQLVYYDDVSIVLVKRNAFPLPEHVMALESDLLRATLTPQDRENMNAFLSAKVPQNQPGFFSAEPRRVDVLGEAETLFKMGFTNAGFKMLMNGADLAPRKAGKLYTQYFPSQ